MHPADLTMDRMDPFVRYVHAYTIDHDTPFVDVIPYDCRCVYILDGQGALILDGQAYPVQPGSLFLWPAGMVYGYAPLSAHPFEALGVNFDYTMARSDVDIPVSPAPAAEFRREELLSPVHFEEYEAFNGALVLADQFWAKDALQQMEREYRTRRNHCVQRLRGQMLCLLCDIARAQDTPAQLTDEVCDSLLDYIHAHFREPLTNESLSRVFSFHPAYLSRIVKRQTGMPLHRYLLRYRLSAAMNLLQTTRLPVSEVAAQSGFPDSNYFSRSFKQQWGGSPGDFRGGV